MKNKIWLVIILVIVISAIVWLEAIKPQQAPVTTVLQTIENASTTNDSGATSTSAGGNGNAVGSTGTVAASATSSSSQTVKQFVSSRASVIQQEKRKYQSAPELAGSGGFINSQPFKLSDLVGKKVVLLDFWTYSCINCIRTIPYLNAWYQKYKDAGLVIVGVHTPEFDFEHDYANVSAAVKQLGIQYPVVLDNAMGTWNAYQNLYWPHEFLINIDGFIVHDNIGEGNYNDTERAIQAALADRAVALGLPAASVPGGMSAPANAISTNFGGIQSPETYFGAARNGYLANGPAMTNGVYTLTVPTSTAGIKSDALYLDGTWNFEDQYATNQNAGASITYEYNSKNVYMVASADQPVAVQIILDGKPDGTIMVQANQLYTIIQGADYGAHTLKLIIQNPGLKAYTFTFG